MSDPEWRTKEKRRVQCIQVLVHVVMMEVFQTQAGKGVKGCVDESKIW